MNIERLFQVLVVGGAIISGVSMADSSMPVSEESSALPLSETTEALGLVFCDQPGACVVGCDGKLKVKEGFECCWGTSCEKSE